MKFDHVDFTYPGSREPAIHDIDFTAYPGQTTAIIGSTGCGKSTIVNLIPRLYDVTEGSITLDGIDIRELSMKRPASADWICTAKRCVVFRKRLRPNLRFWKTPKQTGCPGSSGSTDCPGGRIYRRKNRRNMNLRSLRAERTCPEDRSSVLPLPVPSQNIRESLCLMTAFSALDLKTDAKLRKALSDTVQESTVIIVAQRISTILHADQILVLDEGEIVGKGTHEELMKHCTVYQEIAKSQMSEKELGLTDGEEGEYHE